ncbi:hypothetical protein BGX23_002207, partial [Mortierella sp. AD031]
AEKICESCFGVCLVPESFGVLPVAVTRTSDTVMIQMCRACRLTLYFEHPEPLPAHLALSCQGAYQVGRRVDKTTIEYIYGKIHDDLSRLLPYEIEVRRNGRTRRPLHTYMEQDVLKLARREHGGDIGIIANRAPHQLERHRVYDKHGECRRALLRSVLYDKGLFPDEQAAIWKVYVETGVGDPVEIVNETDTYRWLFQSLIRHPPSPNTDKARLSQILTSEGEPISVKDPRAAAKAAGVKVLTPEEEMRADDERMAALEDLDIDKRLPEGIRAMLGKLELLREVLDQAVEKAYRFAEDIQGEYQSIADVLKRHKALALDIIDTPGSGSDIDTVDTIESEDAQTSENKIRSGEHTDNDERCSAKTSTILEQGFGSRICEKAELAVRPSTLPKEAERIPDHFALVQEKAKEICESCSKRCSDKGSRRALPVATTDDHTPITIMIQMCQVSDLVLL